MAVDIIDSDYLTRSVSYLDEVFHVSKSRTSASPASFKRFEDLFVFCVSERKT